MAESDVFVGKVSSVEGQVFAKGPDDVSLSNLTRSFENKRLSIFFIFPFYQFIPNISFHY